MGLEKLSSELVSAAGNQVLCMRMAGCAAIHADHSHCSNIYQQEILRAEPGQAKAAEGISGVEKQPWANGQGKQGLTPSSRTAFLRSPASWPCLELPCPAVPFLPYFMQACILLKIVDTMFSIHGASMVQYSLLCHALLPSGFWAAIAARPAGGVCNSLQHVTVNHVPMHVYSM